MYALREFVRDSLFVRRASNFHVVCPNHMLEIRSSLSDEDAHEASKLWGGAAVHPSAEGFAHIATKLEEELASEAKYTNPPKSQASEDKRPRQDLSLTKQPWVEECSASLPRGDINPNREGPGSGGGAMSARGRNLQRGYGTWGRGNLHQWRK